MAYRKVAMIQLREIFFRICDGQSKRQVREVMGIHGNTLNKYLDIARELGTDIATCTRSDITDKLIESVHKKIGIIKDRPDTPPRDVTLLPLKDRIGDYLKKRCPRHQDSKNT
jgi:hypothetical protein